jgi:hypothetical protein
VPRKKQNSENKPKPVMRLKPRKVQQPIPKTAQKTLAYKLIYPDGICQVNERFYSKMIQYQDINYQLALEEDKRAIFDKYCELLNYFDSSIKVQLCFYNYSGRIEDYQTSIAIDEQADAFNAIRCEYADMLSSQLAKGNNGLVKSKYLIFGIEADSYKTAKVRLERIELDLFGHLRGLGAIAPKSERSGTPAGDARPDEREPGKVSLRLETAQSQRAGNQRFHCSQWL